MSLEEQMSLLEHRVEALVKVSQKIREENDTLKHKEIELVKKNQMAKTKVEEMINKLKSLDT